MNAMKLSEWINRALYNKDKNIAKQELQNFTLLFASTLLALALVEFTIRVTGIDIPRRSDIRALNGIMRPGYPEFYRFEPNTRTVAVSPSAEFAVEYQINRVGMRDIHHAPYKKPGTTRIVFLGDSLTEGYGIELHLSYPYLIQSLSGGKFDCINAAMRGMSPADYAFRIQNVLDIYKDIDVLVLSLNGKDFYDDEKYEKQFGLKVNPSDHSITRLPFSESEPYYFRHAGPLAFPLSRIRVSWLLVPWLYDSPSLPRISLMLEATLAGQILSLYKSAKVTGIEIANHPGNTTRITFPLNSATVLTPDQVNQLWQLFKSEVYDHFQTIRPDFNQKESYIVSAKQAQRTFSYLDVIHRISLTNRFKIYMIYLPFLDELRNHIELWFMQYGKDHPDIQYISLTKPLLDACLNSEEAIYFPIEGHLTAAGHRAVAEPLYRVFHESCPG